MANDPTEDYEAAALSRAEHSDPEAPGWFVDYAIACYEAGRSSWQDCAAVAEMMGRLAWPTDRPAASRQRAPVCIPRLQGAGPERRCAR